MLFRSQNACNILAARKIETLNIGRVGKSYFITSVNVGFDAEIAEQKPMETSAIHRALYYKKAFSWSSKFKPQKATLNFNDNYLVETDFFNIKISNTKFSELKREKTKADDSLLDVMVTGKMSHMASLKYIIDPINLKQEKKPDISLFRTKSVIINTKKPMSVSVDGKTLYKTPVLCKISGKKLKIIVARKKGPIKKEVNKNRDL